MSHADQLAPTFYPRGFPERGAFSRLRFSLAGDVRDRAAEIMDLVRRKTGRQNVLFLIDEAGQYVAPRGELIQNLDGLARSFKELGQGRVWIVATGQQTLAEITERAAYNSAELNKLRDRFPIALELDAQDIREITWRRLLTKSSAGEATLSDLYRHHGQALIANTRLAGTALYKGSLDEQTFVRLYPFLPQHFDLLLELVRTLARTTGGIGLRSAIRVIQDLLVDTSKVLPAGSLLLADQPVGRLATVDQFFDTLRRRRQGATARRGGRGPRRARCRATRWRCAWPWPSGRCSPSRASRAPTRTSPRCTTRTWATRRTPTPCATPCAAC